MPSRGAFTTQDLSVKQVIRFVPTPFPLLLMKLVILPLGCFIKALHIPSLESHNIHRLLQGSERLE